MLSRPTRDRPWRLGTLKVVDPSPFPQGKTSMVALTEAMALVLRISEVAPLDTTVVPALKQVGTSTLAPTGARFATSAVTVTVELPEAQVMLALRVIVVNKSG